MAERKRVNIKAILADPALRDELVERATDFICKVEGIRPYDACREIERLTAINNELISGGDYHQ